MRMLCTCIDVQVADDLVTKTGLRKHTLNCSPDQFSRSFAKNLCRCSEALSTGITSVANIHTVRHLLAFEGNLLCVDYDNVVTAVYVRSKPRFVLSTKDKSKPCSKTAKRKIRSINENPLFLYSCCIERYCFVALCVHCLDL